MKTTNYLLCSKFAKMILKFLLTCTGFYIVHELKLDSNEGNSTAEWYRLDILLVPSMPWRPYTNLFFLLEY